MALVWLARCEGRCCKLCQCRYLAGLALVVQVSAQGLPEGCAGYGGC